jgi:hypothetical protein
MLTEIKERTLWTNRRNRRRAIVRSSRVLDGTLIVGYRYTARTGRHTPLVEVCAESFLMRFIEIARGLR